MKPIEIVAASATLSWGFSLLMIVRTVQKQNLGFVQSAVRGYPLFGLGYIPIAWFYWLYKIYLSIKGCNFIFVLSLVSLFVELITGTAILITILFSSS
jgi:hypothetical protein